MGLKCRKDMQIPEMPAIRDLLYSSFSIFPYSIAVSVLDLDISCTHLNEINDKLIISQLPLISLGIKCN